MNQITLDAFDIRNAEDINLKGTVVLEISQAVANYLEPSVDATTDLPEESRSFLSAVTDFWAYIERGEYCDEFIEDALDELVLPNEITEYLWCHLARHLHAYSETEVGKRVLAKVGYEVTWEL